MHGFRILQRFRRPWCAEPSAPVTVDDDGRPLSFYCSEPLGHTTEHLTRVDGVVVHRWPNRTPSPAR
jgi:hypothetical protein